MANTAKQLSSLKLKGILITVAMFANLHHHVNAETIFQTFIIEEAFYTRLCSTKKILTVNGEFPGPTITASKGDTVIVEVHNQGDYNITLHWHGVAQPRNPWSDGPEYITQCPIQPSGIFTYKIQFTKEEGTLWWHAHSNWDRATVHGAIIVYPEIGMTYPFPTPDQEIPIILGEWWKGNVSEVIDDAQRSGGDPNISDAFTINGQPGDLYACSKSGTFKTMVEYGKTYLLRVINAVMNNEMFFAIANHQLIVVGSDASYTKPFNTSYIFITPGQTMDILLYANQCNYNSTNSCSYYMAAHTFSDGPKVQFDNTTTTAILQYSTCSNDPYSPQNFPYLSGFADDLAFNNFILNLRSLSSQDYPINVPQTIDQRIVMTVSVNEIVCPNHNCAGPNKDRLAASLNNISFENPQIDILEAYYYGINGVYGEGFPNEPPTNFNFVGDNLPAVFTNKGIEVKLLDYNTCVEVVYQGTDFPGGENHPMHLHGYSFYVVGMGYGNFDEYKDPLNYNLVDPPYQNTVAVPRNGWAAIRFQATNPGVWFMHCHFERHISWGMSMVFIVENGVYAQEQILPPPSYMPPC